jgi:hypothetical protein
MNPGTLPEEFRDGAAVDTATPSIRQWPLLATQFAPQGSQAERVRREIRFQTDLRIIADEIMAGSFAIRQSKT